MPAVNKIIRVKGMTLFRTSYVSCHYLGNDGENGIHIYEVFT